MKKKQLEEYIALLSVPIKSHGFRCATATPPWVADELCRSTLT
jgi:hypothetical protein